LSFEPTYMGHWNTGLNGSQRGLPSTRQSTDIRDTVMCVGCLATLYERLVLRFCMAFKQYHGKNLHDFQPYFSNFTGLFSMGNKDSEALWVVGGHNPRTGGYRQRKSCFCSHFHHTILSEVWSQDYSIGN